MAARPDFLTLEAAAGRLGALRWPGSDDAPTVLAVHGITANAWHFDPLAHHLAGAADLVALDLRGRGRSVDHGGPFGIREHAADVAAIVGALDGPVVLVGHSMGAYVVLMATEQHPIDVTDVLLVDGGTPLPLPDGEDVDDVLDATLGPAIERLQTVWPDRVTYQSMWETHPAFADGLSIDLERNLLADLVEVDGGFRTAVDEHAVRTDGRDLFVDVGVRTLLSLRSEPVTVLRAPSGIMGTPPPLISDEQVSAHAQHRWIDVADTNHYTILLGAVGAQTIAAQARRMIAGATS